MSIFFLLCMYVKSLQSCLTLCDPVDCSPPVFSIQGILQARILEWVAKPLFYCRETQSKITQYRLFVLTCRFLLAHFMWDSPYLWLSPNACYHGGHIFQHGTTPVFQHFLNVADAVFKALSVFENWVLSTFAFPWLVRENCILTGFVFCVLSLPNLLLLSLVQRICNWSWFSLNIVFLDNGPCLGYRKPNQPYRWLSYKQVSRAHDFGLSSFAYVVSWANLFSLESWLLFFFLSLSPCLFCRCLIEQSTWAPVSCIKDINHHKTALLASLLRIGQR